MRAETSTKHTGLENTIRAGSNESSTATVTGTVGNDARKGASIAWYDENIAANGAESAVSTGRGEIADMTGMLAATTGVRRDGTTVASRDGRADNCLLAKRRKWAGMDANHSTAGKSRNAHQHVVR